MMNPGNYGPVSMPPGSPEQSNSTSPNVGGPTEANRKRAVRLQKNREAARECRRKKKEYIKCLENRVAVLEVHFDQFNEKITHFIQGVSFLIGILQKDLRRSKD